MKVDSSAKVPPALSSRLKAGTSHLLMSSVSHLQYTIDISERKSKVVWTVKYERLVFVMFCRHLGEMVCENFGCPVFLLDVDVEMQDFENMSTANLMRLGRNYFDYPPAALR